MAGAEAAAAAAAAAAMATTKFARDFIMSLYAYDRHLFS
jgi:hypothetical protein